MRWVSILESLVNNNWHHGPRFVRLHQHLFGDAESMRILQKWRRRVNKRGEIARRARSILKRELVVPAIKFGPQILHADRITLRAWIGHTVRRPALNGSKVVPDAEAAHRCLHVVEPHVN